MSNRIKKRHPALKHGAYSSTAVLPGEDPAEFEKLYQALIAEWAPTGALEEDIVADIARLVWRKQNLATFSLAKGLRKVWDELESEKIYEKFPDTTNVSRWIRASDSERDKFNEAIFAARDQMREKLGESAFGLVEIGDPATFKQLLRDLEIEERLGALIDKCLKRLLHVRGLKSLQPASSSPPSQPVPPTIPRAKKVA
jgi:hypothetical protein